MAVGLAKPGDGRVGLVLPQSILGSRDAGPVRAMVERLAEPVWSWWSPRLPLRRRRRRVRRRLPPRRGNRRPAGGDREPVWTAVVTRAMGIPDVPALDVSGCVGDHAVLTANFRDEYYGLIPAVGDHVSGPRLVTSGAIDPDRCHWGEASGDVQPPTVPAAAGRRVPPRRPDAALGAAAGGTEAADRQPDACRRVRRRPSGDDAACRAGAHRPPRTRPAMRALSALAAVLSSPLASAWLWHAAAGTGLSARTVRLRPALRRRRAVARVARSTRPSPPTTTATSPPPPSPCTHAYGIGDHDGDRLLAWWTAWLPRSLAA